MVINNKVRPKTLILFNHFESVFQIGSFKNGKALSFVNNSDYGNVSPSYLTCSKIYYRHQGYESRPGIECIIML